MVLGSLTEILFSATTFSSFFLIVLLIASALVSGAEVAFFSLTPALINSEEDYPQKTALIKQLLSNPKRLLATILVANNFINIGVVLLFYSLDFMSFDYIENSVLKLILEVGVITLFLLLFGEILPKIYANRNSFSFARFMSRPLYLLDRYLLFFITIPMSKTSIYLEKHFGQKSNSFSIDKLSQALEFTGQKDTTSQEEQIFKGIVSFGNTDAKQVMCPRIDVFSLSYEMSFEQILPLIIKHEFSRVPVYKEKMDKIEGILYVKDLIPNIDKKNFHWQELLREPYYVPEYKKLDDLFVDFKQKKIHLAVVVDEYGGTAGIITLEDIIEEIVGDLSDEFDEEDVDYVKIDEKNFSFDAKTQLKDFYRIVDLENDTIDSFEKKRGETETIAGFILEITQQLPRNGRNIIFENIRFKIELVDKRRIKRVKITFPQDV